MEHLARLAHVVGTMAPFVTSINRPDRKPLPIKEIGGGGGATLVMAMDMSGQNPGRGPKKVFDKTYICNVCIA